MLFSDINIKESIGLCLIREDGYYRELYNGIQIDKKVKLFEEYCFYDGILDDVQTIVEHIMYMIKINIEEYCFNFNSKSLSDISKCNIVFENIFCNADAGCYISSGNTLEIEIKISQAIKYDKEECVRNWLEEKIESLLVHELTYAKNKYEFYKKYNKEHVEDDWYYVVINNINKYSKDSIVRNFLYALYLSHYGEVQAFSNQTVYEIYKKYCNNQDFINKDNANKKKMILGELDNNQNYTDYIVIKQYLLPLLKNATIFDREKIYTLFRKNNLEMDNKKYEYYLNQIEFACNRAISKVKCGLNFVFKKLSII